MMLAWECCCTRLIEWCQERSIHGLSRSEKGHSHGHHLTLNSTYCVRCYLKLPSTCKTKYVKSGEEGMFPHTVLNYSFKLSVLVHHGTQMQKWTSKETVVTKIHSTALADIKCSDSDALEENNSFPYSFLSLFQCPLTEKETLFHVVKQFLVQKAA